IGEKASRALWQGVRDVVPFVTTGPGAERPLWRISTAPRSGPEIAARIAAKTEAEFLFDWAGGLVWVTVPPDEDAGARLVRRAVAAVGGHATLVRAGAAVRAIVDVFEPPAPGVDGLTRRLKDGFDPKRLLGPGRMYAGI